MTLRILIPSAGGPGCVNLTRSLRKLGDEVFLVGFDASPYYLHLAETDERLLAPRREPVAAYLDFIRATVAEFDIDFIFPNNSLDGVVLTAHVEQLGAPVYLPSPALFAVGESKWETHQRLEAAGIAVPGTRLLRQRSDLDAAFAEFGPGPVWVRGAGIPGKGVGVASLPARTVAQAEQWVEYWRGWGEMAASEYLPGRNLTWLAVYDRGRLVASQGRERDAYVIPHVSPSGITGAPAISHTIRRDDINELGQRVCRILDPDFHGPAFVDFKESAAGVPCVTEINVGRFGTTHHFYSEAGANFPELVVRLALGHALPDWVREVDVLPPDLYWVRTLDAGPVLTTRDAVDALQRQGRLPH